MWMLQTLLHRKKISDLNVLGSFCMAFVFSTSLCTVPPGSSHSPEQTHVKLTGDSTVN